MSAALWVALSRVPGVGGDTYRALLSNFGEPDRIFSASFAEVTRIAGARVATGIAGGPEAESVARAGEWLSHTGHGIVTLADPDYPRVLLDTPDPPPFLLCVGRRELLAQPALAVVGTRNATAQGLRDAESFARTLSATGLTVVSGLAQGIDAAAHRGALDGVGSTIAVIGTGPDIVYPARNRALADEIAATGLLLSEFALGTPPLPANFPRRNRIIAGMTRGCLVVEAAARSGSLITARLSAEAGREVFAIPGSIHSPLARGCHHLIREGAKLVESANDILEELGIAAAPRAEHAPNDAAAAGDPVVAAIGGGQVAIDTLVERTGLGPDELSVRLVELELEGRVARLPGGLYQRLA